MADATPSDEVFISEHGRLRRDVSHRAFDPFRRKVLKVPPFMSVATPLLALVLIPLRLLIAVVSILLSYIVVKLFGPPVTPSAIRNFEPALLPPWRRAIVKAATRFLARALLVALGFWRVDGADHPDYDHAAAERATVVSNHSSLADPCLLAYLYAPAFVAKYHVWLIPGVGRVGAAQHAFYIDRMRGAGFSITDKIVERQRLVVAADVPVPPVAIFPEGTTTNGHHLLKFRTGAFVAGLPVAPVLIRYEYDYFSPSYETIKTGKYLAGLLSQLRNRVRYYRLPVYYPSDEEKSDPALYADNVHRLMLAESSNVFGEQLVASKSNFIDKIEYHSIIRGTKLKKGLQLNMDS